MKKQLLTIAATTLLSLGAFAVWGNAAVTTGKAPATLAGSGEGIIDVGWAPAYVLAGSGEGLVDVG